MDALDFARLSETTLETLNHALGVVADQHEVEILYQSGVLTIEIEEPPGSRIVISPASAVSQIWISAQSTSFKLDWDEGRQGFVYRPTGELLAPLVGRLTGEELGVGPLSLAT